MPNPHRVMKQKPKQNEKPYRTTPENAPKIVQWIKEHGGFVIWRSCHPSNRERTWTTPIKGPKGERIESLRPNWLATPERFITDVNEVVVANYILFKRLHVGICKCGDGINYKITDASNKRLQKALDQAAEKSVPEEAGSSYRCDYDAQDVLVYYVNGTMPLAEWAKRNPCANEWPLGCTVLLDGRYSLAIEGWAG